jgi:hypothetical protein
MEQRRALISLMLKRSDLDEDVSELAAAEGQLADVARERGDLAGAARFVSDGLAHADAFGRRTGTPITQAALDLLCFAAELQLDGGAAPSSFGFDVAARLRATFDQIARGHNPTFLVAQKRIAAYLSLLKLDGK